MKPNVTTKKLENINPPCLNADPIASKPHPILPFNI